MSVRKVSPPFELLGLTAHDPFCRNNSSSTTSTTQDTVSHNDQMNRVMSLPLQQQMKLDEPVDPAATPKNEVISFEAVKRSRSPRPKTLPGLVSSSNKAEIPGLAQLAGKALLNSPQAPQQVKAFARTLVEGLLIDCTGQQQVETIAPPTDGEGDEATDVSFSLAVDEQPITKEDSSHAMDPDSLEESKDS